MRVSAVAGREGAATRTEGGFLEIVQLTKSFGDTNAVHEVDVVIDEGEFFTLLGPSGCGKSTLLRVIGGFERPTSGCVRLRGSDLTRVPPERRPFNMVFQSYALFPHLSVIENVAYGPRTAGAPARQIRQRVTAVLELVHLQEFGDRAVTELSGGQQQRVALARALVNEPEVLLLDEPLGALDLQLRRGLQSELRNIQRRLGTTFIYVTHDQEEALYLSHRVAVMEAGKLAQVSDTRGLYDRPTTRFVAEFVGDANLIECEVTGKAAGLASVRLAERGICELHHYGTEELAVGARALAVLRPHHLELAESGGSPLAGSVASCVFLGDVNRIQIRLDTGTAIEVDVDPGTSAEVGERIGVQIKPGCGAVVPCDECNTRPPDQGGSAERDALDPMDVGIHGG